MVEGFQEVVWRNGGGFRVSPLFIPGSKMAYSSKVYIVQKANGEVIGAKLSFDAAHRLAKSNAPAIVLFSVADKTPDPNVVGHASDQAVCR